MERDELRIRERRRRLGLTQHQLAKMAGVSQSLVAKIECGSVDAAYSKVKRIEDALECQSAKGEKTAREIMHARIEAAHEQETLHAASARMSRLGISQMPVVKGGHVSGSISEQAILTLVAGGKRDISGMSVSEAMEEGFPQVSPSTPFSAVAALLKHHPAVIVVQGGKPVGIITKADLLKTI